MNIRQRRWIKLLKDYDCTILYHPSKTNIVVDALSRKFMGSLVAIARRKPHLLHDLKSLRAQFIVRDSGVLLARISVQSNVVKRIKLSCKDDP